MTKLFLTGPEDATQEQLYAALDERLSSKYDVFVSWGQEWDSIKVRKNALMAIVADAVPKKDGTEFKTAYAPGSNALALPLMLLLIPIIFFVRQLRSPARKQLEAEVIEAIRDKWPNAREQS